MTTNDKFGEVYGVPFHDETFNSPSADEVNARKKATHGTDAPSLQLGA